MKKIILIFAVLILVAGSAIDAKQRVGVSFGFFYSELSPYGEWIEIDADVIVWRPTRVNYDWAPYSVGRWVYTDYGWTWDSYEPFGWATYHYGRWFYEDYYGWVWLPDYEWGPAWVEWRYSSNYIGWAPLPPYARYRHGYGIQFSINWNSPYRHWHFVTFAHFHSHNIHHYFVDSRHKHKIFNSTRYRTNYYERRGRIVNAGIDRELVERYSGRRVENRELKYSSRLRDANTSRTGSEREVEVYKPSEDVLRKSRNSDDVQIKKSNGKTSLLRDKIAIHKDADKITNNDSKPLKRTNDKSISEKGRRFEIKKSDSPKRIGTDGYKVKDVRRYPPVTKKDYETDRSKVKKITNDRNPVRFKSPPTKNKEIKKRVKIINSKPDIRKITRPKTSAPQVKKRTEIKKIEKKAPVRKSTPVKKSGSSKSRTKNR
ncbi:MAG: hypothetical protein K9J16_01680 [Melioribacteraceae bacterium]|nr:hypothetical protein [Melioribacteraceae bacterium]MCF8352976.1 hypothetical protein [Melioribacteraceae bacterium]MCF8395359.1 hypothetical protein [Melioribacteraceae bacterium]MCF8417839.1 hypothetical protein [Melioribacteraceae bacterium]